MDDLKNRIEAVLFTTGRFLIIDDISKMVGVASVGIVKDKLNELKEDYEKRESSLEIVNEDNKWKINIKKNYLHLTERLLSDTELDRPTQETLAVIAYKQPILQSDVIKIRGNKAYDHIKLLLDSNFVTSEKSSRTRILKLTQKFYDYFDVVDDNLKNKLDIAGDKKEFEKVIKDVTDHMIKEDSKTNEN
ncbi:MAG TPA: SMC-Scp complex subunit ScpB [Candidatus Nanoarchaeia archaeon]|nr:SMC-Scp complex subunit ScpB [Candidatus Nanoarchaeia archaeon]